MTLKEPTALMALADIALAAGDVTRVRPAMKAVLDLMSRPFTPGEVVLIKPTNVTNPFMDQMLSLRSDACALLLYSPLPNFLKSLAQKGTLGALVGPPCVRLDLAPTRLRAGL